MEDFDFEITVNTAKAESSVKAPIMLTDNCYICQWEDGDVEIVVNNGETNTNVWVIDPKKLNELMWWIAAANIYMQKQHEEEVYDT